MKKLLILLLIVVSFTGCQKSGSDSCTRGSANGVIVDMDGRKCACCWGWIVEINNTRYKFDKIPANSTLDLNTITYPTPVYIEWRDSQDGCSGKRIEVLAIEKR